MKTQYYVVQGYSHCFRSVLPNIRASEWDMVRIASSSPTEYRNYDIFQVVPFFIVMQFLL